MKKAGRSALALLLGLVCSASVNADVTHVVLCWFKAEAPTETLSQAIDKSAVLAQIPGVLGLHTGTALASDRPVVDDSFDIGLTMRFADQPTLQEYLEHPTHVEYVATYITPWVERIQIYDIVD